MLIIITSSHLIQHGFDLGFPLEILHSPSSFCLIDNPRERKKERKEKKDWSCHTISLFSLNNCTTFVHTHTHTQTYKHPLSLSAVRILFFSLRATPRVFPFVRQSFEPFLFFLLFPNNQPVCAFCVCARFNLNFKLKSSAVLLRGANCLEKGKKCKQTNRKNENITHNLWLTWYSLDALAACH